MATGVSTRYILPGWLFSLVILFCVLPILSGNHPWMCFETDNHWEWGPKRGPKTKSLVEHWFYEAFCGGSWWIRTTEALSSRFTVCPHWPLGKAPLFSCLRSTSECLIIIAKESGKCKPFFEFFSIFFERFWNECGFVHFWKILGCYDAENALFSADFSNATEES